jgi:glycosyltransferase involved in cell wall biosynthesis
MKNYNAVSIVVPMKNSSTTILHTLESISKQTYPVREIIVIDNKSADNSAEIVNEFKKKSKIPVHLIVRRENKGVGASYNLGADRAKSELLVFMHSDSSLDSVNEMNKLLDPVIKNSSVVASYSTIIHPSTVWETYNFWQKCLFARAVDKRSPGLNGKFDCIRRNIFLRIGGFDDKNFGEDIGIGGEDADLHYRLLNEGKVVLSKAEVIHLHYLGNNYSMMDWIQNRKLLARTYGRLIRVQKEVPLFALGLFSIKPLIAIIPIFSGFHSLSIALLFSYAIVYSKKMFVSKSTLTNPRILLLPFLNIFLLYYEVFWTIHAFFTVRKRQNI